MKDDAEPTEAARLRASLDDVVSIARTMIAKARQSIDRASEDLDAGLKRLAAMVEANTSRGLFDGERGSGPALTLDGRTFKALRSIAWAIAQGFGPPSVAQVVEWASRLEPGRLRPFGAVEDALETIGSLQAMGYVCPAEGDGYEPTPSGWRQVGAHPACQVGDEWPIRRDRIAATLTPTEARMFEALEPGVELTRHDFAVAAGVKWSTSHTGSVTARLRRLGLIEYTEGGVKLASGLREHQRGEHQ